MTTENNQTTVITAKQATEITINAALPIKEIYDKIVLCAKQGMNYTWVNSITNPQISELIDNGYVVEKKELGYRISW